VLKRLFEWAHRNARFVEWALIESIGGAEIRLNAKLSDLPEVPHALTSVRSSGRPWRRSERR
jgi:hypothetical protein